MQWCHTTLGGGPSGDDMFADLVYFPNALRVLSPNDNDDKPRLQVYMIQKGYNARRVVATCCGTLLLGDHPNYQKRKLVTCIPPGRLLESTFELLPPQRRIFTQDLSEEEQNAIADFNAPPNAIVSSVHPEPPELLPAGYMTAQTLMDDLLGGEIYYMMPAGYKGKPTSYNKKYGGIGPTHQGEMM